MTAAANDRPEQSSAADFVHAGDGMEAARAQFSLQRRFTTDFATRRIGSHGEAGN